MTTLIVVEMREIMPNMFIENDGGRSKYFKTSANDCTVRALAILLKSDYKEVYQKFLDFKHPMDRTRYSAWRKVYQYYGLCRIELDIPYDDTGLAYTHINYIANGKRHNRAYIHNTIHDTWYKDNGWEFSITEIWATKENASKLEELIYG